MCDQCPDGCPHEWEAVVASRSNGAGCSFCANRRACPHNSLAIKAPAIAAQFSAKNQGSPQDYTVCSRKKVMWQCELGHGWTARIDHRTSSNKTGCPVCCRQQQKSQAKEKQPVLMDCQQACMQLWDWELNAKAGLHPNRISCKSNKKASWICLHCPKGQPHRWQATVASVFYGSGCPCCSGHKACKCNSLQSLAPEVAAEWDFTKNRGTPSDYPASSHAKVWWCTDRRGSFQAQIFARTRTALRKQRLASYGAQTQPAHSAASCAPA